jgi:hypothetical protein
MVNKTPLRLVAIEETLLDADQSATPVAPMTEAEAITRKVPNSAIIAAQESQPDRPKRSVVRHRLVPAAAIAVVLTVAIVVLATRAKKAPPQAPEAAASPVVPQPAAVPQAVPQPIVAAPATAPVAAPAAQPKLQPEVIRLEITAEPKEAELSLDGNVLAGHRLNLQVPRDRGIHVLSAAAPGYIPFNQQVSFSADVVLAINLRRGHTPPARQPTRARPSQSEPSRPNADVRSAAPSRAGARVEPGMNMEAPVPQHNGKPIDERNPYKP